jgi:uncharacterized protein (TIGR02466 family)
MSLQRLDVYASPIWMLDLPEMEPHLAEMISCIHRLRSTASKDLRQKSNRNGWHSGLEILEYPEFQKLKKCLIQASRMAFEDYGVDPEDRVFNFAGWANVHDRGGYNTSHVHPGSWISGSFYLKVPEGSGKLFFEDPRQAIRMEHIPLKKNLVKDPLRARGRFNIQPKPCRVVMFPSWFEHGVDSADCDERISIAFNVTPVQIRQKQQQALVNLKLDKFIS